MHVDALRNYYRLQAVAANGGLLAVDLEEVQSISCIHTLLKIQQAPIGTIYLASLTVPFKSCSFVVKIQTVPQKGTDMRDARIANRLLMRNATRMVDGKLENWTADPYAPTYTGRDLMKRSEQAIYEADFPQHPLTLCRSWMKETIAQIHFSPELKKLKPFR